MRLPCALAIGGLDPGGGAGLAADLRGFGATGAFGCAVIAVVTVQSTSGLRSVQSIDAKEVKAQAREVMRHQRVRAIKTGALGSDANVRAVGELLAAHADVPAVVDPVIAPTRGKARLLAERALDAMRRLLVPRAALITANVGEAEALTGMRVSSVSEAHDAALALCRMGARAALVKGGHMTGAQAIDVLALQAVGTDGKREKADVEVVELRARRLRLPPIHGGGCTFAALVAGHMAVDERSFGDAKLRVLVDAVRWAKRIHHRMLGSARDVGGEMRVLVP
ncbi:MAG TPA: bifunctional hydroxymethylpyrimidine kinase/phosphomethylpyrimidine kinase [Polyangiaceae bacterium]|jgi:hydroxymethylpyrimidine/phosphomethylpyrimidine kinase